MKCSRITPIEGEKVVAEFRSSKVVLGVYLSGLLVALVAIIFILAFAGIAYTIVYIILILVFVLVAWIIILNWQKTVYIVTSHRVKSCAGIIGSKEEEVSYDDVQDIEVHRSFWGAIFGFGDIMIEASGQQRDVIFDNVHNPKEIVDKISSYSVGNRTR